MVTAIVVVATVEVGRAGLILRRACGLRPDATMSEESFGLRVAQEAGVTILHLRGSWRLRQLGAIEKALTALPWAPGGMSPQGILLDGAELDQLDTAAALALLTRLGQLGDDATVVPQLRSFQDGHRRVLELVADAWRHAARDAAPRASLGPLARVGRTTDQVMRGIVGDIDMLGAIVRTMAGTMAHPRRLRLRELVGQLERVGLDAIPVIVLVTGLIGVVIAYLLGLQARLYGANLFVVDGVAIGAAREFSPLIVAVVVAGRSGAAFTAELGTMRLTQEVDALRTFALAPLEVLVLPRAIALGIALPLLVFVGDMASLAGALVVARSMLDIAPGVFLDRLQAALTLKHIAVGLMKAPVFAMAIAVIGCRIGLTVDRDARAVGAATTATVVQCIVAVILLDAAFAVLFQRLGW